jgi:hypothetical protein
MDGPQRRSERREGRENSWYYLDSNSEPFVDQLVASRHTNWAIPAPQLENVWHNYIEYFRILIYTFLAYFPYF